MSKLDVITIKDHEKELREVSKLVSLDDPDLKDNIAALEEYCIEHEVMAMALVQLGIPKRIIYLKNTNLDIINKMQTDTLSMEEEDYNEARVLINPVVVSREGLTEYWEACASCLDNLGLVKRPYKIVVEYFDIEGNKHSSIFEGFEATVLSHELDHLDGILHIDIASKLLLMSKEDRKKFRQEHGYHVFTKNGVYEELLRNYKTSDEDSIK